MSELIVITYPDPAEAERVIQTIERLQSEHLVQLDDYTYVTRDLDGTGQLACTAQSTGPRRCAWRMWGAVVGRLFGSPRIGAGLGAVTGAIAGRFEDAGVDEGFVRALSANLRPGSSAIFALVQRSTPDKVLLEVGRFGGTIIHTSLSNEEEQLLQSEVDEMHNKATSLRETTADSLSVGPFAPHHGPG